MSISSLFDDTTVIKISYSNLGIADGETYIENTDYNTLTAEEKTQLLSILSKYTYARKMSTVFSNGSSNGVGSEILLLYTENRENESQTICISSLNEIIVDNHVYTTKDSWKMIEELKEIISVR